MKYNELKALPLSQVQDGIWLNCKILPEDALTYSIPYIFHLVGILKIEALQQAWNLVIQKHAALRTHIIEDNDQAFQVVSSSIASDLEVIDKQPLNQKQQTIEMLINIPFKINSPPLCRAHLICYEQKTYCLLLNFHHLIIDGLGINVILQDFSKYYNQIINEQKVETPKQDFGMRQYLEIEKSYLTEIFLKEAKDFWLNTLSETPLSVDLNLKKSNIQKIQTKMISFDLNEEQSNALKVLIRNQKSTLFIMLSTALGIAVNRYFNQAAFTIAYPYNLSKTSFQYFVNCFANTLLLPIHCTPNLKVSELLHNLKQHRIKAKKFSFYPIKNIIRDLRTIKNTQQDQPNISISETGMNANNLNLSGTTTTENTMAEIGSGSTDLSLYYYHYGDRLRFNFLYNSKGFSQDFIQQLANSYKLIISEVTKNPYQLISQLPILSDKERRVLLVDWNRTEKDYPTDKTIHQLFEEQVEKTPNNTAIVFEDQKLTYKQLNEKSNQLARYLKEQTIGTNLMVGICLDRSNNMLIAILAILKAGYAYVPIDPAYPIERIQYILTDTKMPAIITQVKYKSLFNGIKKVLLDQNWSQILCIDTNNLNLNTNSNDLAYIIYTSGSTGKPKGVMIEHKGVINTILSQKEVLDINTKTHVIGFASIVFDVSIWEYLLAFFNGATLCLAPKNSDYLDDLIKLLKNYDNCLVTLPVTVAKELPATAIAKNISALIVGGEACDNSIIKKWANKCKLINAYGPTECSICVSSGLLQFGDVPHIGRPIANAKIYVLDPSLNLVPIGVTGELYVWSPGLTRGYLNRSDLTAKCFIKNPFGSGKLYKTGDLVRYMPNGNIEYIGRTDLQVKLRGFRIELEEIENVLSSYEGIEQSVVIVQKETDSVEYLVGYYVSKFHLDTNSIRTHMQRKLPEYMVPNVLVKLDSLPLTINGKLDRKILPKPALNLSSIHVAPRNDLERKICKFWSELLGLPEKTISIQQNFFMLGGSSILTISLVNKINHFYKSKLKVADVFFNSTVEKLAFVVQQTKGTYCPIVKLNNSDKKKSIFMIHPGASGCEVYTSLAESLSNDFSCYGIDSYNLYNDLKINSLHKLSQYYLSKINETIQEQSLEKNYNLLGWSLGGVICLQIASILESRGYYNIKVYILDSIIFDDYLISVICKDKKYIKKMQQEYTKKAILKGYDTAYIQKVISIMHLENEIIKQHNYFMLDKTQTVLFKAMRKDEEIKNSLYDRLYNYSLTIKYNNIDKIYTTTHNIKVIPIQDASHYNILEKEYYLISEIKAAKASIIPRENPYYFDKDQDNCRMNHLENHTAEQ